MQGSSISGLQAAEFVGEVEKDGALGLMQQAAQAHPGYTLCLMVVGLEHYLTHRQQKEFTCAPPLFSVVGHGCPLHAPDRAPAPALLHGGNSGKARVVV